MSSAVYLTRTGYVRPAYEVVVPGHPFPFSSKVKASLNTVPRITKYLQFITESNSICELGSVQTSLARFIVFEATSLFQNYVPFSSPFPSQAALVFE